MALYRSPLTVTWLPSSFLKKYEHVAICKELHFIDIASDLVFGDISILIYSRASIQHHSRWTTVGDMISLNIRDLVAQLSFRHPIYFQWIPFYNGLNGNEIAHSLVKSPTADTLRGATCLTFAEHSSIKRTNMYFGEYPLLILGILGKYLVVSPT
ncbi:hypothetical protein TNCV_2515781 [Trichonephila clavipes]|nr:hypothetical protein TNCV_2515781 [Trichonephila clavipes]